MRAEDLPEVRLRETTLIVYSGNQETLIQRVQEINLKISELRALKHCNEILVAASELHKKVHELILAARQLDNEWFLANKSILTLIVQQLTILQQHCAESIHSYEHHFFQFMVQKGGSKLFLEKKIVEEEVLFYRGTDGVLIELIKNFNRCFINFQKSRLIKSIRIERMPPDIEENEQTLFNVVQYCVRPQKEWLKSNKERIEHILGHFDSLKRVVKAHYRELHQSIDLDHSVSEKIKSLLSDLQFNESTKVITTSAPSLFHTEDRRLIPYNASRFQLVALLSRNILELFENAKVLAALWRENYKALEEEENIREIEQFEKENSDLNEEEKALLELLKQKPQITEEEALNEEERELFEFTLKNTSKLN